MNSFTVRKYSLRSALLCTSALVFLPVSLAGAANITVPNGTTETTTITLLDPFDTLFIDQGGVIYTTSALNNGVDADNDDQTVNNAGIINAASHGIVSNGIRATVINSGTIDASNTVSSDGIRSSGFKATITNTGKINAGDKGIQSTGANAEITNNGEIIAKRGIYSAPTGINAIITNNGYIFGSDRGIWSLGDDSEIVNTGSIVSDEYGIDSNGEYAVIINSGKINAVSYGIFSRNKDAKITNRGTINSDSHGIRSTGTDAKINNSGIINVVGHGIYSLGADAIVTNSGIIVSNGGPAIILDSTGGRLNLRAGSVLYGGVLIRRSGVTLDIGTGLNLYLDYSLAGAADPILINSAIPIVHDEANTVIYTVDPTGFALAQSFVQTTAEAVHGAVRTGSGRGNRFGGGFGGQSSFAYGADAPGFEATGPRGWV
ncbi:MAG: hypothetical protein NXI27_28590, partial [Alphaproteobacteria bacterium]|nr:hypothetical protein [Alphaproteobacteria bacterium]